MLIRKISYTREGRLKSLKERPQSPSAEEILVYPHFNTRTLNPQIPLNDILFNQKQQRACKISFNKPLATEQEFGSLVNYEAKNPQKRVNLNNQQINYPKIQSLNQQIQIEFDCPPTHKINDESPLQTRKSHPQSFNLNNKVYLKNRNQQLSQLAKKINPRIQLADPFQKNSLNMKLSKTIEQFYPSKYSYSPTQPENISPRPSFIRNKDQLKTQSRLLKQHQMYFKGRPSTKHQLPKEQAQTILTQPIIFLNPLSSKETQISHNLQNQKNTNHPKKQDLPTNNQIKNIQISYRTSLLKLKSICHLQVQNYRLSIKIPQIFTYPLFSAQQQQQSLLIKATQTLHHLKIEHKHINLKKYSNCVIILTENISLIWHFSGKIYFGGWKHQYLDEGCKQGLGLQWSPKKYVYYGQFQKNERHGYGIMKNHLNQVFPGLWQNNRFIRRFPVTSEQIEHN